MAKPKESIYNEVFISYSRKNKAFVQKIVQALYNSGRENIWVDWEDIEYAEDWWEKIQSGIDSADNFIFILTPDSVQSQVCYREVEHAVKSGKRIIPVEHIPVTEKADFEKMHPSISSHNWLPFKDEDNFQQSMKLLFQTIDTDLVHVKLHTRFLVRAREWELGDKNPSFLFRGDEIDGAEKWLAAADKQQKSPAPTQLHRDYIAASRERDLAEKRRLRLLRITSMVAAIISVIAIVLTIVASLSAANAREEVAIANDAGTKIAQNQATVEGQATFFAEQQQWIAQLAVGGVIAPPKALASVPDAFYATATAVTELEAWSPVVQELNCVDELCAEVVQVPAGCFWMGRNAVDDAQPTFYLCISEPYWIDRYVVSNALFERLEGQAASPSGWDAPDFPRTDVTWQEASNFCLMRGGHLPSEPLWEYAARGAAASAYPWGNEWNPDVLAWGRNEAVAVNAYPEGASWVGAYNMSGNVWEWTSTIYGIDVNADESLQQQSDDIFFRYPYRPDDGRENTATSPTFMRAVRGGSYQYSSGSQHTATRTWVHPELKNFLGKTIGFRCVFSAESPAVLRLCGDNSCDINENENTCPGDCSDRFTRSTETPTPTETATPTATATAGQVQRPICGNYLCEYGENSANCSIDCAPPDTAIPEPVCGNNICENGETVGSCFTDCGVAIEPPKSCGNNVCDTNESTITCPSDCNALAPEPICGNNSCEPGENSSNCSVDCAFPSATPIPPPICGDGFCDSGENSSNCGVDCGFATELPPICGDGFCDYNENSSNCGVDCGFATELPPICGDGFCDYNENSSNCGVDCGFATELPPICGDGFCDYNENSSNCGVDCGFATAATTATPSG